MRSAAAVHERDLALGTAMYGNTCPLEGSSACPNDESCHDCTFDVAAFLADQQRERDAARWEDREI